MPTQRLQEPFASDSTALDPEAFLKQRGTMIDAMILPWTTLEAPGQDAMILPWA